MHSKILYNGNMLDKASFALPPDNRAFRYGDGVFESMRVVGGKVLWPEKHFDRLRVSAKLLKMQLPAGWSAGFLQDCAAALYEANHPNDPAARFRLALFRSGGGLYAPLCNKASYLIESEALGQAGFSLNTRGAHIGLFADLCKPVNAFSPLKTINAQLYVMAGIYKRENGLGDCLLLNNIGHVVEASASNIFVAGKGKIITPPLSEGCVDGVMRSVIIEMAAKYGLDLSEEALPPVLLEEAEEVFLTNAVQGIRWVGSYGNKRYYNGLSRKLNGLLNEMADTSTGSLGLPAAGN